MSRSIRVVRAMTAVDGQWYPKYLIQWRFLWVWWTIDYWFDEETAVQDAKRLGKVLPRKPPPKQVWP